MRRVILISSLMLPLACAPSPDPEPQAKATLEVPDHLVDLTHAFGPQTIYWPTDTQGFDLEVLMAGPTEKGYYYAANRFSGAEHGGAHLDAPIHFYEGRSTVDEIALERLIAPGVVVSVEDKVARDRDYQIQVEDLLAWEVEHGRFPDGSILLFHTGLGQVWPDREKYLGTASLGPDAIAELHFPGLAPEAAEFLVSERSVVAIGLDTASIDYGQSTHFESHITLFEAEIPVFENVAQLDHLPVEGFLVVALPMKIEGGSGGPLRIIAMW